MAITVSDQFKALWRQKIGTIERRRVGYKRRYWNGSAFANESAYKYLYERDIVSIGSIPNQLDSPLYNIFRSSVVTLQFNNEDNQWVEHPGSPSIFAQDSTAPGGYRLYKTIFQVQIGYELNDGTIEWISVFTGLALRPKFNTRTGIAEIQIVSKNLLMEKSDAEKVSDLFTLENCIPATGDGSNKDFETTSIGVDRLSDLQVDAVSQFSTQGSTWNASNNNKVAEPGNTGRLAIKFQTAPGSGLTVKSSGLKWKASQAIETLVGLLCDQAGITSSERSISPVVFPGGVSGSKTIDAAAQWQAAGATLQNADVTGSPGNLQKRWFLVDDFTDGDYTASPVWSPIGTPTLSIVNDAPQTNVLKVEGSQATTQGAYTLFPNPYGTWRFQSKVPVIANSGEKVQYWITGNSYGNNGYMVQFEYRDGVANDVKLIKRKSGIPSSTETDLVTAFNISAGWHEIRVTRDTDGNFELLIDGVSKGTANDTEFTTNTYFQVLIVGVSGFTPPYGEIDDFYWSPGVYDTEAVETTTCVYTSEEFDLLAAPTAWGTLDRSITLNGGAITFETNVASAAGGPYDGWVAPNASNVIQSALKRYLQVRATITPASGSFSSPVVDSMVANFQSSSVFLALAKFSGKTCASALDRLVSLADYETGFDGSGNLFFRSKDTSGAAVVSLTQENAIIEVLDWDPGFDRVRNVGRVKYGDENYTDEYDGADASEASPTSEQEYGRIPIDLDFTDMMLSNDAGIGTARARSLYENNYRPKLRIRMIIWAVPWLEVGDKVNVGIYDHPMLSRLVGGDPLLESDSSVFHAGNPGVALAASVDMKVIEYKPDWDTNKAEIYVEAILA